MDGGIITVAVIIGIVVAIISKNSNSEKTEYRSANNVRCEECGSKNVRDCLGTCDVDDYECMSCGHTWCGHW
jgi:DNA-directed RNA polymerase subunit RPC12/RpoP